MKPTLIKISISQDGLLPQQSIELGEKLLQSFPRKLMTALDFEKIDDDRKKATFVGILPVFVVIGEKTQEIEMELTVVHPELRDKVIEIFTAKPPAGSVSASVKPQAETKKSGAKSNSLKKTASSAKKKTPAAPGGKKTAKTADKTVKKPPVSSKKSAPRASAKSASKGKSRK